MNRFVLVFFMVVMLAVSVLQVVTYEHMQEKPQPTNGSSVIVTDNGCFEIVVATDNVGALADGRDAHFLYGAEVPCP